VRRGKATVVEQFMQRAPVFRFDDAVAAREFGGWIRDHFGEIKRQAEQTTRFGKLDHIEQYQVGPARFPRFNYTTGDAAGQNTCGKATAAACEWIRAQWPGTLEYLLSGNIDTDKKHSLMNTLYTRGRYPVTSVWDATDRHDVEERSVRCCPAAAGFRADDRDQTAVVVASRCAPRLRDSWTSAAIAFAVGASPPLVEPRGRLAFAITTMVER
jgi:hydroxymethylglutaryl-CoA reductase